MLSYIMHTRNLWLQNYSFVCLKSSYIDDSGEVNGLEGRSRNVGPNDTEPKAANVSRRETFE